MWAAFRDTGDRAARDQLVVHYAPLVKYVAGRVGSGLPRNVEQADLTSFGMFGLLDAIDKFDPSRAVKFETYAIARIRGAIIDELRATDWVPRSVRTKAKAVEKAFGELDASLGRAPTDAEVAERMGVTGTELRNVYQQVSFTGLVALDDLVGARGENATTLGDTLPDRDAGTDPSAAYELDEVRELLADAIGTLRDREKIILTLYYYEGLTLGQIGEVLGVTESRVCQLHTRAVLQLRARLSEDAGSR
jgi:RNA polymerase sigma factor FliA